MPIYVPTDNGGTTVEQIAVTLLRPAPAADSAEYAAWTMWIADAYLQIRSRLGDLELLDQANLAYVVREAVAAKAKRPDAMVKVDVSVDDGSTSKTYERGTGQVLILDEWWALLRPGIRDTGAWTINPRRR